MNNIAFDSPESRPNPEFDADRASRVRGQAQEAFLAKYRKAARLTWAYLLLCVVVVWWCVRQFLAADDVRSWILWGGLCLVAFETTILIKLWYWVVNSKLSALREIKLLRLDLALHKGSQESLENIARLESPTKLPGVTNRERYAWFGAILAVGLLVGRELMLNVDRHYRATAQMTSELRVHLADEGTAEVEATYELANSTSRTLKEFTVYSGGVVPKTVLISPSNSPWSDAQDRKLAVRREPDPNGPNHRDVIQLIDAVPPGQRFTLRTAFTSSAHEENGIWTFSLDQNWGYPRNFYRETIILPAGAELVSAEPLPLTRERQDEAIILQFEGRRGPGVKWAPAVKYKLSIP